MARSVRWMALLAAAVVLSRCSCGSSDEPPCPSGQEPCRGVCTDPATYATDPLSCGACAVSCGNGTCSGGTCQCAPPEELCPTANPRCVNVETDGQNCGGCGISCGVGQCAGGSCDCAGFVSCPALNPRCVDGLNDPRHCGTDAAACTNDCPLANESCVGGTCTCAGAFPDACPTACVNFATDPANCGGCGNACVAGQTCSMGQCVCPAGRTLCAGACVDLATDEANCGACARACAAGAVCASGECTCPPPTPTACGGTLAGGACCEGTVCCGSSCGTKHRNGVGGSYFDCVAIGTYDAAQAEKAARSWAPGGHVASFVPDCASTFCLAWQTSSACGTWCYGPPGDPLRGRAVTVASLVCQCPLAGTPDWD